MSKRLFILSSLLETHPRRATTEARMRTTVVVKAEIGAERGRAPRRAPIRYAIRPLAQERLDEAFGFAVRLGPVGPRETMPQQPALTNRRKRAGTIDHRVVGHETAHADAAPAKPRQGPLQKRRGGGRIVSRNHLGIGEARRVINRDMQILPADVARAAAPIAMNAMADPGHAAK